MIKPDELAGVRTREDFVTVTRRLAASLNDSPEEWENPTLPRYLDALAAWIEDMDGFYERRGEIAPEIPWKVFAEIIVAAKYYE